MAENSIPGVQVSDVANPLPESLVVLDVREDSEWDAGHIADAVHIPLGQLPQRVEELPEDAQILAVCHAGGRSAQATAYLLQRGIDAVNLEGGMIAWQEAGRPTTV